MRRTAKILFVVLTLLFAYVGTFSYWWQQSPRKLRMTKGGIQVEVVEFEFNKVSWHTQMLWFPAFWSMEHVFGYQQDSLLAMEEHSVVRYVRPAPPSKVVTPK
jgi:hypothetical protein